MSRFVRLPLYGFNAKGTLIKLCACVIPFNSCIVLIFSVGRSKPTQKMHFFGNSSWCNCYKNDIQWGQKSVVYFQKAHKAGPVLTTIPKHAWSDRGFIACTRPAAGSSGLTLKDRRGFRPWKCAADALPVALVALGLPPTCHHLWSKSQRKPRTKPNLSANFSASKLIKILGVYT